MLVAITAIAAAVSTPVAYAGSRPVKLRISFPSSVRAKHVLVVSGRASGPSGGAQAALQQQKGKHWITRSRVPVGSGGSFRLRWRAPRDPAIAVMRVALLRGGRARAYSHAKRLHVSAPVRVLKAAKLVAVPAPGTDGVVRYHGTTTAHPGDIVAAGISPASPSGFLGEVTSVQHVGGDTVLQTKPTSLIAAVPEGTINASIDSSSGLATTSSVRGGPPAHLSAGGGLRESIAKSFSCSGGVSASLGGSVSLTTSANFSAHWSLFHGIDRASFTGTATASAELGASVSASASCMLAKRRCWLIRGH